MIGRGGGKHHGRIAWKLLLNRFLGAYTLSIYIIALFTVLKHCWDRIVLREANLETWDNSLEMNVVYILTSQSLDMSKSMKTRGSNHIWYWWNRWFHFSMEQKQKLIIKSNRWKRNRQTLAIMLFNVNRLDSH